MKDLLGGGAIDVDCQLYVRAKVPSATTIGVYDAVNRFLGRAIINETTGESLSHIKATNQEAWVSAYNTMTALRGVPIEDGMLMLIRPGANPRKHPVIVRIVES